MLNIYPLSLLLGEQALQRFYVAFTYRYGEHLTISWCGQEATKVLLRDRRTGAADILHQNDPRAALGPAVPPMGCASLLSPPWQSLAALGSASIPRAGPLWAFSVSLSVVAPVKQRQNILSTTWWKNILYFYPQKENEWTISSFFFPPLLFNNVAKPRGCTSAPVLHAELIKVLTTTLAG